MLLGWPVLVASVINSKVASLAYLSRVKFSIFVLAASCELYSPSLVITIFAKTFRIELSVCVFTLCDLTNLFTIGALFDQWRQWFFLATNLLNRSNLLINRFSDCLSVVHLMIILICHTRLLKFLISIFRLKKWQNQRSCR